MILKCSDTKKKVFVIAVITIVTAALYAYLYCMDTSITNEDTKRPDINSIERIVPVKVSDSDGNDFNMDIVIQPLQYGENNIEQAFDEAEKVLDNIVPGENDSLDSVDKKLNFPDTIEGYPFSLQWLFDDYELINYDGSINNMNMQAGEKKNIDISCVIKYEGWIRQKDYHVTVCAPDLNDSETKKQWIKDKIETSLVDNPTEDNVKLPDNISGEQISYQKRTEWNNVFVIVLLGVAAVCAVYAGEKKKTEDAAKKRAEELKRDYSEMIHKLALLMGAGMTVRMAWSHIVNEYKERLAQKKVSKKYVYEEMAYTLYQMNSGVSEINAYGEFGTRCDTKEYLKFSSLVVQNLKKGSRELVNLLELEAIDAFEDRKNLARKYGEEAGTKMLFPMVMMLVVVMVIIMFPAIMTFSM